VDTNRGGGNVNISTGVNTSTRLSTLSDDQLINRLQLLCKGERRTTLSIILHLAEIDERRAYLPRGYWSLFDYCTRGLKYSESAAGRRIRAARCVRRFPEVYRLLSDGRMNLTVVSRIASILTRDNAEELLAALCGKTRDEVEMVLARYQPGRAVRDRATPVYVPRDSVGEFTTEGSGDAAGEGSASDDARGDAPASVSHERWLEIYRRSGGGFDPALLAAAFKIEFAASRAFMSKLEEVKSLLSSRLPTGAGFEIIFEALMNEFIERHSPERKAARRLKRQAPGKPERTAAADGSGRHVRALGEKAPSHIAAPKGKTSRHIPRPIRDTVYARDRGQCTFVGTTGVRCISRHMLQLDHIVPFARGGLATAGNLRLLCAQHNRLEAERAFGAKNIRRFYPRK
jgi:hypothetical protein